MTRKPNAETTTVVGIRLDQAALGRLDGLLDEGASTRSAWCELVIRDAISKRSGVDVRVSQAAKAARGHAVEVKKRISKAIFDEVQDWLDDGEHE